MNVLLPLSTLRQRLTPDLNSPGWLVFSCGLVGLFTGAVTVLYRLAVLKGNASIWGNDHALSGPLLILLRFSTPALGGLAVGLLLYKVFAFRPGHGIPSVIHSVQTHQIRVPWRMAIPSMASVVVLTTGGSAGPEGPVAEIGSVFGSNVGGWIGAKPKTVRTLVGSGVAAAIAAVFGAPISGVFFALEVIFQGYETASFAPVVISAVVASLVSGSVFHNETAVVLPQFTFQAIEFPAYIGLGLLSGLVAAAFIHWIEAASRLFERIPIPLWTKPALGGAGVGIIGVFLPFVIGEGYEFLNQEFKGEVVASQMALILAGKFLATGLTLGSGAPGGCFAPAIFLGGTLGGLYGKLLEAVSSGLASAPSSYALMGMAGLIAGTFNAPITAIMIALRVTHNSYDALIPLMTTVALSTFIMGRWNHMSVYTMILKKHGQWFPGDYDKDPLLGLTVMDVLHPHPQRLQDSLTVDQVVERISTSEEAIFLVEGEGGQFRGIVSLHDLRLVLADPTMGRLVNLEDVIDTAMPRLKQDSSLREAVHVFSSSKLEALPVFDSGKGFVGLVTRQGVLVAYQRAREESDPAKS
jgi:CIC family chloride channel protein